jgi:hypothetical protein
LTDANQETCLKTIFTFEPFVEINLGRQIEVHTVIIKPSRNSRVPALEVTVGDDLCQFTNAGDVNIRCLHFPKGRVSTGRTMGQTDSFRECSFGSPGGQEIT